MLAGGSAVFSAAASGSAQLAYQWLKNGANLANASVISGATTATLTLNLTGSPGVSYVLESTTNFTSGVWRPVTPNVFDLTGRWQFNDTSATNYPQQFYRLRLVQ